MCNHNIKTYKLPRSSTKDASLAVLSVDYCDKCGYLIPTNAKVKYKIGTTLYKNILTRIDDVVIDDALDSLGL